MTFEGETEDAVTVNSIRYKHMIMEWLWPQLDALYLNVMCFQQAANAVSFFIRLPQRISERDIFGN